METNWAAENLQTIRTLMERSALYRRALAPLMTFAGILGIVAATLGVVLRIATESAFIGYWLGVALAGLAGTFLLVRRQALKNAEAFWSPPTRRVAMATLPCLTAGLLIGILFFIVCSQPQVAAPPTGMADDRGPLVLLAAMWAIFYGCALHAAGFFTSRGLRLFGWLYLAAGMGILFWVAMMHRQDIPDVSWQGCHWLMGALFGALQLAYGVYLYFTEQHEKPS
jgi:hypothetical protein